jgi:hypothetical protein
VLRNRTVNQADESNDDDVENHVPRRIGWIAVSEQRHESHASTWSTGAIDDLARAQHATVVTDSHELADEIWDSDDELDAFLADLRASRNASLA